MSAKYTNFKHFEKGVPNRDPKSTAKYRNCMHCGSTAHWTAFNRTGTLKLDVRLCNEHNLVARAINKRRKS